MYNGLKKEGKDEVGTWLYTQRTSTYVRTIWKARFLATLVRRRRRCVRVIRIAKEWLKEKRASCWARKKLSWTPPCSSLFLFRFYRSVRPFSFLFFPLSFSSLPFSSLPFPSLPFPTLRPYGTRMPTLPYASASFSPSRLPGSSLFLSIGRSSAHARVYDETHQRIHQIKNAIIKKRRRLFVEKQACRSDPPGPFSLPLCPLSYPASQRSAVVHLLPPFYRLFPRTYITGDVARYISRCAWMCHTIRAPSRRPPSLHVRSLRTSGFLPRKKMLSIPRPLPVAGDRVLCLPRLPPRSQL